jgi:hypothetical protein
MPRKRKFKIGDWARINRKGPARMRGRVGVIVGIGFSKEEYGVEFADGQTPTLGYYVSLSLDEIRPSVEHRLESTHAKSHSQDERD